MPASILLVEDNPGLSEVTVHLLEDRGFDVFAASTGSEALALAHSRKFDAALIDLHLPDISGVDLAKALAPLPIAILSGDSSLDSLAGASVFLHKPLSPSQLVAAVEKLLNNA